ncbi:MAG: septum formation protein Maf [Planctomycetes bacterium]|nr:septum formation protein Maf [Planctomycetota bacterium]
MGAPALSRPLVLASASPRRSELLRGAGLAFRVEVSAVDEQLDPRTPPEEAALELAERKARAVAQRLAARTPQADVLVLAADTIVAVPIEGRGSVMLAKAADEREAESMLRALSGTRHRVITGVCALRTRDLALERGFERTFVTMRALTQAELAAYVASGEWRDKAGAYAIQESADRFVTSLEEGGFDNVVGLPVKLSLRLLAALDLRP